LGLGLISKPKISSFNREGGLIPFFIRNFPGNFWGREIWEGKGVPKKRGGLINWEERWFSLGKRQRFLNTGGGNKL